MGEILYFPALGWRFILSRVAFTIGPVKIHWYGLLIGIGVLIGLIYVLSCSRRLNMDSEKVLDVLIYSVLGGIVGARIYYVIFSFDLYRDNIWDIFKIWEGGIAIYGGIIGAFITGIVCCKIKKIKILLLSDLAVGGLILAQAIGRWGNFVNIEAYGKNTSLLWGMTSISIQRYLTQRAPILSKQGIFIDPSVPVHPCFLYESIWCLIGFSIIYFLTSQMRKNASYNNREVSDVEEKQRKNSYQFFAGEITLFYFIWYGMGRFFIEGLRVDSLMLGRMRVSQVIALLLIEISILLWIYVRLSLWFVKRKKDRDVQSVNSKEIPVTVHIGSAEDILKRFSDEDETMKNKE